LDALTEVGFSDTEVAQIAWQNWRRVLGAWWK
jgi:microsomal dipeptidase-like Zn-dependent dipeptidase